MISRISGDRLTVPRPWTEQPRVRRDINPERRTRREIIIVIIKPDVESGWMW